MSTTCQICGGAIPNGEQIGGHTALCAGVLSLELSRLRAALEQITRSHPKLVTRGGGPAPWLVAKAALLDIRLGDGGYEDLDRARDAVIAEWAKTEPSVRR